MIKYSIIICSYNRYQFLVDTIDSVINVLKNREDFEIIIIDNNSKDLTYSLKEKYVNNSNFNYFLETKQGLSNARNRGLIESSGEILVYLDDDIELVDNYFEICDEIFSDVSIKISGGKVLPFKVDIPDWLPSKYYHLVSVYDLGNETKYVKHLMGGNFAIRRLDALKIGTYNISLGRTGKILGGGEETDYQNRASAMGYKMYYNPKQNILHKINDKLNEDYILSYALEMGKCERLIDDSISKIKVLKKVFKSYIAMMSYFLLKKIITNKKRITFLKIIYKYSQGYLKKA